MEAINDDKIERIIKYFLSGGTAGAFENTNEQGFSLMEASNTHTITASIAVADPSRPVFVVQQADIQDPRLGAYVARFPSGVSRRQVFDLYPISDLYLPIPAMDSPSDTICNAYFTLDPWPSGARSGVTPFTPSACGFFPLALNDGAGYGVANSNFSKVFDRGYTVANRLHMKTTIVDAGNNALQGSIYGGIVSDKVIPSVATKSGIAGLTTAHNGSFLSCGILDPVVSVLSPATQEVAYFTNNSIRERSQTRLFQSKFLVPTPNYSMRQFGVDSNQLNNQGVPCFNAIENELYYNQQGFRADLQWYGMRKQVDSQPYTCVLTLYADWATVDSDDNLQITSVTCNQFDVVMPDKDFILPFSANLSCQVKNPIAPLGASINPMTFYFVGLRFTMNIVDQNGNLLPVDEFLQGFAITSTITIDDLSLCGDEVGAIIALNDFSGPFEVTQDVRYCALPNSKNTALLGGYTVPPTFADIRKITKEWLGTTFGRAGGMIGTSRQYDEVLSNTHLVDKVFLEAPPGGHTMSSYLRSIRNKQLQPTRGMSDNHYFAKSFMQKLRGVGSKLNQSKAGRGLIGIAKGAYKIGGDMLYDELEDLTGVDVKELRDTYKSSSYYMSSYDQSTTREYGCNSFDPKRTLPAKVVPDHEHPEVSNLMDKPHLAMALARLLMGQHREEDHSLLAMALASLGRVLHMGHTSSSAKSKPPVDLDPSYGQEINGQRVVRIGATVPAIQHLALRTATTKGKSKFVAVGSNASVEPLVLTLTVHQQMPVTRQLFDAVYFDETPSGIRIVGSDSPVSFVIYFSTSFGLSQAPQEVLDSLVKCVTYLRRCSIQFANSDYVTLSNGYIGEPLSGDSFLLAFTAACLNVPIGPVFTGTVDADGRIGRVGEIDIKISTIVQSIEKFTLFLPIQDINAESQEVVDATILRMSLFKSSKVKASILPVSNVAFMMALLNSTIMSAAVVNARDQIITTLDEEGNEVTTVHAPFKSVVQQARVSKVGVPGASQSKDAINKVVRDAQRTFRSDVYKLISDNKGSLTVDGEVINNVSLGNFKRGRPSFAILSDKGELDLPLELAKDYTLDTPDGPMNIKVLDRNSLSRVEGKTKIKLKAKVDPMMEDEW